MSEETVLAAIAALRGDMHTGMNGLRAEMTGIARVQDEKPALYRVEAIKARRKKGERLERVEDKLTEIGNDINVAMSRLEHVDDAGRRTRDEVRVIWRMVKALQTRVEGVERR